MSQHRPRIVHITNQSSAYIGFTLQGGRVVLANTPETFGTLANRNADLIVIDLNIEEEELLRFMNSIKYL